MLAHEPSAVIMGKLSAKMNTRRPRPKPFEALWNELRFMRGKRRACFAHCCDSRAFTIADLVTCSTLSTANALVNFGVLHLPSAVECVDVRRVNRVQLRVQGADLLSIEPSA